MQADKQTEAAEALFASRYLCTHGWQNIVIEERAKLCIVAPATTTISLSQLIKINKNLNPVSQLLQEKFRALNLSNCKSSDSSRKLSVGIS